MAQVRSGLLSSAQFRVVSLTLSLQDVRELLDEGLEAGSQSIDIVGVAVVGDDSGDRREKPDRGCDQRLGLALIRGAHRSPRAVHRRPRRAALPAVLGIFAEARGEDALQGSAPVLAGALEQFVKITAFPELVLEAVGIASRAPQAEKLQEDLPPGPQREQEQQPDHRLHHDAGVGDHGNEAQIGVNVQASVSILVATGAGMRVGRQVVGSRQASVTCARASTVSSRHTSCAITKRPLPRWSSDSVTCNASYKRAGCRYSICRRWTTKAT